MQKDKVCVCVSRCVCVTQNKNDIARARARTHTHTHSHTVTHAHTHLQEERRKALEEERRALPHWNRGMEQQTLTERTSSGVREFRWLRGLRQQEHVVYSSNPHFLVPSARPIAEMQRSRGQACGDEGRWVRGAKWHQTHQAQLSRLSPRCWGACALLLGRENPPRVIPVRLRAALAVNAKTNQNKGRAGSHQKNNDTRDPKAPSSSNRSRPRALTETGAFLRISVFSKKI